MITGKKIRKYRKLRGLTQKELGVRCGFPESQADVRIRKYESGLNQPNDETLEKIAAVLDVDPVQLYGVDISNEKLAEEILGDVIEEYGKEFVESYLVSRNISNDIQPGKRGADMCSILQDVCPYHETENPCRACPLFQVYVKHQELVKKYWEEESIRDAISEEAFEYESDVDGYRLED